MATYEAILQAAEETIVERGLRGAGMVEIAARAGVAVGTLYNHFEDRDALVAALVGARRRELLERLDIAAARTGPFAERLRHVTEVFFVHLDAHRPLLQVLFQEPPRIAREGRPDEQACMMLEIHERIEKVMASGAREGALGQEGAGMYAALYLGMLKGCFVREGLVERRSTAAALAATVVDVFLGGAAAR